MKTYHVTFESPNREVRSVFVNSNNKNQAKSDVRELFNEGIKFININQVKKWKL